MCLKSKALSAYRLYKTCSTTRAIVTVWNPVRPIYVEQSQSLLSSSLGFLRSLTTRLEVEACIYDRTIVDRVPSMHTKLTSVDTSSPEHVKNLTTRLLERHLSGR